MGKYIKVKIVLIVIFILSVVFYSDDVKAIVERADVVTWEEFNQATTKLINETWENDLLLEFSIGEEVSEEITFATKRLIIKAKSNKLNLYKYNPSKVIRGPENIFVVQFDTIEKTVQCYDSLLENKEIDYVEPDLIIKNEETIVEEIIQENISDSKAYSYKSWGVKRIETDKYMEYLLNKGDNNSVTVAIVDSGVDSNHPFLKGKILDSGYDFVYGDNYPYDDHGHGTHVAGTVIDNMQGLNVNILPIKVLNYNNYGTVLNCANGIRYAADNGADVVNYSIYSKGHSRYIDDAVKYATSAGTVVVACAGNDNVETINICPAHMNDALVVAASNSYDERATFSDYGDAIDVIAPGVNVVSSYPGGGYVSMSGTSMATPHISAVAAMYKLDNPQLTPLQIENKIKENTIDLGAPGKDIYYGNGIPKLSLAIPNIPLESISLNYSEKIINKKQDFMLEVSYNPFNTTELKKVTWSTSNDKVAKVDNGKVSSVGLGQAIITAKVGDKTASCLVTVEQSEIINIPDKNLKRLLNRQLGNEDDSDISITELLTITEVSEMYTEIESLEGLQYAANLQTISFNYGNVSDISCFENVQLNKLRDFNLYSTKVKDISIFETANFPELYYLNISGNAISDLSPLKNVDFPKLEQAYISNQKITLDKVHIQEGESVEIYNIAKDIDGKPITKITNGVYSAESNTVTWNNIKESTTVNYRFEEYVKFNGKNHTFYGWIYVPVGVDENIINIPDENLRAVINETLYNKEPSDDVTLAELKNISYLYANNRNITNLEGLQYAPNLTCLDLSGNNIRDFTIFKDLKLTNIETLNVSNNNIENIEFLENINVPNLNYLYLSNNEISDLDSLGKMKAPNMKNLYLDGNYISDIQVLNDLKSLKDVSLNDNKINKLGVLQSDSIEYLTLSNNEISDISDIRSWELPNLKNLNMSNNAIMDISPINGTNINKLEFVYISGQRITLDSVDNYYEDVLEISNPVITLDGSYLKDIYVNNGKYDSSSNNIIWENIFENTTESFKFSETIYNDNLIIIFEGEISIPVNVIYYYKEDINEDGEINEIDIEIITKYYNSTSNDSIWNERYDLNNDGIIDIYDIIIINKKVEKKES